MRYMRSGALIPDYLDGACLLHKFAPINAPCDVASIQS
jgi:hypothetical protein